MGISSAAALAERERLLSEAERIVDDIPDIVMQGRYAALARALNLLSHGHPAHEVVVELRKNHDFAGDWNIENE